MNKQIIIGTIVVIAVVAGILVFRGQGSDKIADTPTASSVAKETPANSPAMLSPNTSVKSNSSSYATLKEAYNSGKSVKCSINTSASQKFTFYFKDGNIRYETSITSGATTIETGQIIKKDIAYGWTSMSSSIITTTDPKTIEFYRSTAFQLDTLIANPRGNIQLVCVQTTVSNSLFDKPKN